MKRIETYSIMKRRHTSCFLAFICLCFILLTPHSVAAGTICGTVRDMVTGAPIIKAGVFVRTIDGTYTGYHGATDDLGGFCIESVPAGTYDLEVRVDNYATGYIRNVEVTDDPTSVQIELDVPFYFASPWPNPAQRAISFRFRTRESVPSRLLIFDPLGRLVRGWSDPSGTSDERFFIWDLTDNSGKRVPSGVYFVRFLAGEMSLSRSFVLVK